MPEEVSTDAIEDFELTLFDRLNVIRDTVNKYGEDNFYLSFSGGSDSTVLHYMLDEALPNNKIPRVFIDTGIEYNDIRQFVIDMSKHDDRIQIIKPVANIQVMLMENGYPFKSKEHSTKVETYQKYGYLTTSLEKYVSDNREGKLGMFSCPKVLRYQFQPGFNLKLSGKCCTELKKHPARKYEKESGRKISIQGIRTAEGGQRKNHTGCITFKRKQPRVFKPLNPCSDEFMKWYMSKREITLCKLYYPPFNFTRTGCKGCPFSLHLQEQLDIMEDYLPLEKKQCEVIWKPVYEEYRRLGYRLRKEPYEIARGL